MAQVPHSLHENVLVRLFRKGMAHFNKPYDLRHHVRAENGELPRFYIALFMYSMEMF